MIRIFPCELFCLFTGQVFCSLVRLEVVLHPDVFALLVVPLEGVTAVPVHMAKCGRCTPVGEKDRDLMDGFRGEGQKIPKHIRIRKIRRRMTFLCMNEVGKFERVPNEEDRGIVSHQIVIALLGIELYGEAPGVSGGIG